MTTQVDGVTSDITVEHEAALADLLGRLHTLPLGEGAAARPGGALHHDPAHEGRPHQDLLAASEFLDAAEPAIDMEQRPFLERLRQVVAAADGCEGLPEALLHPDMVGPNVLVTNSGERVAIDWTGAGRGARLASFAFLLWGAGMRPGGDASIIDAIVRSYRLHVELTAEEIDRLPAAMRVRPAYFASWGLWRAIDKGQSITGNEWWWPELELGESIATTACAALVKR